jgi:hypothetical protein
VVEDERNIGATDPACGESRISDPVDLHERTASLGSHLRSVARKADEEDASVDLWGRRRPTKAVRRAGLRRQIGDECTA